MLCGQGNYIRNSSEETELMNSKKETEGRNTKYQSIYILLWIIILAFNCNQAYSTGSLNEPKRSNFSQREGLKALESIFALNEPQAAIFKKFSERLSELSSLKKKPKILNDFIKQNIEHHFNVQMMWFAGYYKEN